MFFFFLFWFIYFVQVIFWLASSAEIVVILASQIPESAFNQKILRLLVPSGSAEDIRPTTLFLFGVSLTYIGSYIRWSCFQALGKMFTFEMSIRKDHQLVKTGPYSIVRHPAYTGVLLTQAGIICWHASPVCFHSPPHRMTRVAPLTPWFYRVHG